MTYTEMACILTISMVLTGCALGIPEMIDRVLMVSSPRGHMIRDVVRFTCMLVIYVGTGLTPMPSGWAELLWLMRYALLGIFFYAITCTIIDRIRNDKDSETRKPQ